MTLCHEATRDIAAHARERTSWSPRPAWPPGPADWIKPGATVLSVGLTRTVEGILGDVHPDVSDVAGWFAPPIGGVGPMTRAMLLTNVVEAAERI